MKITWKITYIWNIQEIWAKKYPKRVITIEEIEWDYQNSINLDAFWNHHDIIAGNNCKIWDVITAHFNSRCNEYKGRYYNTLSIYKLEKETSEVTNDERFNVDEMPFKTYLNHNAPMQQM